MTCTFPLHISFVQGNLKLGICAVLTHSNGSAGSPGHLEELKALDLPPVHDNLDVRWHKFEAALDDLGGPEAIFWHLHGHDDASDTFWLDRSGILMKASPK